MGYLVTCHFLETTLSNWFIFYRHINLINGTKLKEPSTRISTCQRYSGIDILWIKDECMPQIKTFILDDKH